MESSVTQSPPPEMPIKGITLPLFQSKGWMRFLGVMAILEGILAAMSFVGIVVAWLPIWMGVLLFQAAGDVERAYLSGEGALLENANRRLKTYFILRGVSILLEILIVFIMISFVGTMGFLGALSEM